MGKSSNSSSAGFIAVVPVRGDITPHMAKEMGLDSKGVVKTMCMKHLVALEKAGFNGAGMHVVREIKIKPVYHFKYKGKRMVPKGYPNKNISDFKGLIEFECPDQEAWHELRFFMTTADNTNIGAAGEKVHVWESLVAELDWDA